LKVWAEWSEHIEKMKDAPPRYSSGEPALFDEYKRIVLTIACAVTNPGKHGDLF
jgi:hypothetical protein